jgi:hypothetical protein
MRGIYDLTDVDVEGKEGSLMDMSKDIREERVDGKKKQTVQ